MVVIMERKNTLKNQPGNREIRLATNAVDGSSSLNQNLINYDRCRGRRCQGRGSKGISCDSGRSRRGRYRGRYGYCNGLSERGNQNEDVGHYCGQPGTYITFCHLRQSVNGVIQVFMR